MNSPIFKILVAVIILGGIGFFLYNKSKDKNSVVNNAVSSAANTVSVKTDDYSNYTIVPEDEFYTDSPQAKTMLEVMKARYKNNFDSLANSAKEAGAKLVFCWLTTEPNRKMNVNSKEFIKQLCNQHGVEFVDFVPLILSRKPEDITFMPKDGHFNKVGAKILADKMAEYIRKYNNVRSTQTYTGKPKIYGDLEPNQKDAILDGGKDMPYKVTTNSQGLRMNYDVADKKTKQRILILGDSGFYFPFLDNDQTGTAMLQSMFPDKEIINAANWGYSVDDYWSQWKERVKYVEPDVVFLQSSGEDVANEYFTHRLKFSRHKELIKPTEEEKSFYSTLKPNAN